MNKEERFVSFFQSPSTGQRKAVIWKDLPRNKIDLKYEVVKQINENNLPEDMILGDVLRVTVDCVDIIQQWMEYKVSIEACHDCAIDSMHYPKKSKIDENGFTTYESNYI